MTKIYCRPCRIEDAEIWAELNKEFIEEEVGKNGFWSENSTVNEEILKQVFLTGLEMPKHVRFLIIEKDEKPIGFVNIMYIFSVWARGVAMVIDDMFIRPAHRGQRYGTGVMKMIEKYAEKANVRRIQLHTDFINTEAQNFYESLGYIETDTAFYLKRIEKKKEK